MTDTLFNMHRSEERVLHVKNALSLFLFFVFYYVCVQKIKSKTWNVKKCIIILPKDFSIYDSVKKIFKNTDSSPSYKIRRQTFVYYMMILYLYLSLAWNNRVEIYHLLMMMIMACFYLFYNHLYHSAL